MPDCRLTACPEASGQQQIMQVSSYLFVFSLPLCILLYASLGKVQICFFICQENHN